MAESNTPIRWERSTLTWIATTDKGGYAALTVPSDLTDRDLDDFDEWLRLIRRTLQRHVQGRAASVALPSDDQQETE